MEATQQTQTLKERTEAMAKQLQKESGEWKALILALRANAPPESLQPLAEAALVTPNQLLDFRQLYAQLRSEIPNAERWANIKAKRDAIESELDKLEKKISHTTTDAAKEPLRQRCNVLLRQRRDLGPEIPMCSVAYTHVTEARRKDG